MPGLRLSLLGGFDARLASGAPLGLPSKKAQALLAYLGTRPGQPQPRDKLAALLWGERSDHQARGSLRHALAALRKALAAAHLPALRIEGQAVALDPDGAEVDVVDFERQVAEGTPQALERAAEIYRGDLLLGFALDEPLFEDWLVAERERLREMALEAMARLLAHQTGAGGTERAIRTALRLLALDPLQEAVHRSLMGLYARQGRRGAALRQYQLCVDGLRRELGTEPEAETKALYRELLRRPAEMPATHPAPAHRREQSDPEGEPVAPDLPTAATPLFGRDGDLARLRERLELAVRKHGQVATVVGEAGIGKTRLVSAVAADAVARDCQVLIGRCYESDSILPFGPWVDACRGGRLAADPGLLGALHPARRAELARLFPEAGTAGLPQASDSPLPLFESVAGLIEEAAARRPLMLVLEDIHWADEMTLRLLAFVGRRIPSWPVLLIVTAREEDLADAPLAQRTVEDLSGTPPALPVRLAPLSRPEIALIVRALARPGRDAPALAHLEERIWAMSEGNPLVAVEGMLAPAGGEGPRAGPGELSLPERVRELIARRLDRLTARAQSVAAVAAVIGRQLDFGLLRSATGMDERHVAEAVEEMVRGHVLRAVGDQLDFTHDRVRDVAYTRLLPPRRRILHSAVAGALEAMSAGPGSAGSHDVTEELAHHALRGAWGERAVEYLRQAADRAARRSALQNARTWFEQALAALETLPATPSTLQQAFEIRLALRPVLVQLGELPRVLALLREAEALAERLNDESRRGLVSAFLTNIHSRLDEPTAALVSGARALGIAQRLGDVRVRILATTYLGQAHYYRGEYTRVIELATSNLAVLPSEWVGEFLGGSQPPSVNDRFRLLVSLAHLGRFTEAAEHEADLIRVAEPTQHAYTVGMAYYAAGTLHLIRGEWAKARALIERQIAVLRGGNVAGELPTALAYSARALASLGDASEARDRCREAERLLEERSTSGTAGNGWIYYSMGRASLVTGDLDEARRLAGLAVQAAADRNDFLPDALHLAGDVAVHPDRRDAARGEACYTDALVLAEARGMRPLVAHCHLGFGRLHGITGNRASAREHLGMAAAMYRGMGMRSWLDEAEAAIRDPA